MSRVVIYDTTLRDGAQRAGLSLSLADKLRIASLLDELGVDYIEGGWPGANPKDTEFFERAKNVRFAKATLTAFGMTRRPEVRPEEDEGLRALLDSGAPVACIVGKSWDLHVTKAVRTTLEENLRMVEESCRFLRSRGLEVFFDAEHFFDGYRRNPAYAMAVLRAALEGGASCLVLCDTNGGSLPHEVGPVVRKVKEETGATIGVHCHNDSECAVANSLAAVMEGATHVQGTANGYGERCGNANLMSIIPALVLKMGIPVVPPEKLARLTEIAHHIAEIANITPDPHQPYVGHNAFAHKGGLHVSAVARYRDAYNHIPPETVGNTPRLIVSELAGRATVQMLARDLAADLSDDPKLTRRVLERVKELENRGYHFEAADGSFELLLRREAGRLPEFFRLESFRVIVEKEEGKPAKAEATVKVWAKGERVIATGEGNGPVNALDRALRQALGQSYPGLSRIQLTDYKVRILDSFMGTGAVTRVLIESTDGERTWGTVGVSANIIEASWEALSDSICCGLLRAGEGRAE
jgi:2-isopropylmalate synthase